MNARTDAMTDPLKKAISQGLELVALEKAKLLISSALQTGACDDEDLLLKSALELGSMDVDKPSQLKLMLDAVRYFTSLENRVLG